MVTLSQTPKNVVQYEMCDSFNKQFLANGSDLAAGQLVTLNSDGSVSLTADNATLPFGVVIKAAKDGFMATISTNFRVVLVGAADGTIQAGAMVCLSQQDNGYGVYSTATTEMYAVGQALADITDGGFGEIGLFYTPVLIPN